MKHWKSLLEVLLIFILFFIYGAYAVPDVNEAHYLEKAVHFWNPNYAPGDFFLNSPDAHGVFYWSFGWTTLFLPLDAVVWLGRILTWLGLAAGWLWMSRPILKHWGTGLLSAGLYLFLTQNCSFAGEWIVGGVEAKGFAYIFAFFGIGEVIRNHWNRALILLGFAAMFHVIVGGWCLVGLGIAWLILKDYERGLRRHTPEKTAAMCYLPTLRSILPGLAGAFFLTLPALIPALLLNSGVSPEIAKNATQLYVYERLPHHLLLSFVAQNTPQKLIYFGALFIVWNFLCARPRFSNGEMTFRTFIYAAILIMLCGWAINLFMNVAQETVASLLRYYWFRLADAFVPIGAAILCTEFALRPVSVSLSASDIGTNSDTTPSTVSGINSGINSGMNSGMNSGTASAGIVAAAPSVKKLSKAERKEIRRHERAAARRLGFNRKCLLAFLIFLACFQTYSSAQRFTKPMKPRSCSGASCGESWQELCRYVRENTEPTDVFIVPYTVRTFRWYTGRCEVGVWKDIPQDAQGLWNWWTRMQDQFYGFDPTRSLQTYGRVASFTLMPKGKFEYLKKEYNAKYIVRNKNDLKGRTVTRNAPNGLADYELIYENKDFELRKLQ